MRTRIARFLLHLANRIATETTMCSTAGKWQFKRDWCAVPYKPEPHKWARTES